MRLPSIFDVFSRRTPAPSGPTPPKPLTETFRNRLLLRLREELETFYLSDFWPQLHRKLTYLHGRPRLSHPSSGPQPHQDAIAFLLNASDNEFLDAIELMVRVENFPNYKRGRFVHDVNEYFEIDGLPYALTDFIWDSKHDPTTNQLVSESFVSYPQIIRRDSSLVHASALEPALTLLPDKGFKSANQELLAALADYRRGDYGDCLVKCGSAFESTLKLICDRRGWSYKQTDTASVLVGTVVSSGQLEGFLEQPLMLIATIRNRLSTAHGAGNTPKSVSQAKAEYAINATASAVLLLVKECS